MPNDFIGINQSIKENARASSQWRHQQRADHAYAIFEVVNEKLFNNELPDPVIGFDDRLKKTGEYYFQGDSISLHHHFDIRTDLNGLEVFIAILHNCVHSYQNSYKTKAEWYHSKAFREELAEYGIDADDNGNTISIDPNKLENVLDRIGLSHLASDIVDIDLDETEITGAAVHVTPKIKVAVQGNKGTSKMKKWSCACNPPTNVRCATNLTAYCTECDTDFEEQI